ncbi:hypothetical protein [Neorhizobium sp. DT-125]|uniref:hypothetical protein n=1 Tax=Neorhizobium sp. DT-125 TaxID=3396163 RepID=UPI003F1C3E27
MKGTNEQKAASGQRASLSDDGFTIVEMLVALCVTALLSSLLAVAVVQLGPMQRISEVSEGDMELAAAGAYLHKIFSNARRLALIGNDPDRKIALAGDTSSLRLVSIVQVGSSRTSLRDIEILARKKESGIELVQRNGPRRTASDRQWEEFTIIAGLQSVRFQYLSEMTDTTSPRWLDSWSDREDLPTAIKINLLAMRSGQEIAIERTALIRAD